MTITYFNDINVYFHMKNHYKILRNVKSVVDTSIPESLVKCPMAMNNLDKCVKAATNEHLRKIYNTKHQSHPLKRRGPIKKHNCLNSEAKSEASLCLPSRPNTRRNSNASAYKPCLVPSTSYSIGPLSKSDKMFKFHQRKKHSGASLSRNSSDIPNSSLQLDLPQESVNESEQETPLNSKRSHLSKESPVPSSEPSHREQKKSFLIESSEEHEYLLFLLRITEDIISNDFYSNHDINNIFKAHMELNKDRLNKRKMHLHIANLCKELNIDCKVYQLLENSDETDPPMKYQNSPIRHRTLLNNEAFKSCQDCSVIRTSSLHKLHPLGDSSLVMENIGDGPSISPSLLKLLGKLSLGRVTECTEPVASISAMNSPHLNFLNSSETDEINLEISPVDFETFIKELNSKENFLNEPSETKGYSLDAESLPTEINPIKENPQNCTETSKNSSTSIPNLKVSISNLETPKVHIEGSARNIELSEKENTDSEKYDSEFEKCSSNNSISIEKHRTQPQIETPKVELKESQDEIVKSSRIPVPIKESKASSENIHLGSEIDIVSSKSSVTCNVSNESEIHQSPSNASKSELNEDHEQKPQTQNEETEQQINSVHPNSPLKVILQGTVSDDDYVMIQGPVYVYKPLLESEPKLIVFSNNANQQQTRRDSLDSQHSHRTFTVDHSDVLDQAVQCETSLHSMEIDKSMENILELTKTAYSQFRDLKLLQSDYDLTPEKDSSENKYHHLMVDATTSNSCVNLAERLLLSDDYVVNNALKKISDESNLEIANSSQHEIDDYLIFEPKMYENNYVIHRKLMSSVSMPKLKLNSGQTCDRNYGWNQDLRYETALKKCSSDLINFDVTSQDSSLRSEGETVLKSDYLKNGISGNRYHL